MTPGIRSEDGTEQDAVKTMEGGPNWSGGGILIVRQRMFWVLLACCESPRGVNILSHPWHRICAGIMMHCKRLIIETEWKNVGGGK